MALLYLLIALVAQSSLTYADVDVNNFDNSKEVLIDINDAADEVPKDEDSKIEEIPDFHATNMDWMDMFLISNTSLHPTSSIAKMSQVTNSNKTAEEQLEDIKEMAHQITLAIQSEMANLLTYAMSTYDKEVEENHLRKRRSIETPTDSTQLIMRLLKHIKSNNEYQNLAIEKMMSAQEIADKFGIEFNPDPEILSDLAVSANEQTKELTSILEEACTLSNVTGNKVGTCTEENNSDDEKAVENNTYYVYKVVYDDDDEALPPYEYIPHQMSTTQPEINHVHYSEPHSYYNYYNNPHETQIPAPAHVPVSHRPSFYDSISYQPDHYSQYYSLEPMTSNVIVAYEEEPEPELVAEELEETISSKMIVERGEQPGSATVNHITTYTVAEKSHFRTPEIEKLPEHVQYSFFLM